MTVKVLIVDDQEPFRQAARMVVDVTDGFEVVGETDSLPTAVELCRAENPSILLTTPFGAAGDPEQTLVQAMARALCSTRVVVARGTTAESTEFFCTSMAKGHPRSKNICP